MVSGAVIALALVGVVLLALGSRGYLEPAAKEAGVLISDLVGLRERLSSEDSADKDEGAAKGDKGAAA